MPAQPLSSLFRVGSMLALALVLAGCTKGGQFDPTDFLNSDTFDSKKKIPGDREPLFPSGVPGITTGVPADLVKGYQPPPDQAEANPAAAPVAEAVKPKPQPKPKPKLAAAPPPPPPPPPPPQQPQQAQPRQAQDPIWNQPPATPPKRISVGAASQQAAPAPQPAVQQPAWPAATQAAPGPQEAQPAQPVWPDAPAPGKSSQ